MDECERIGITPLRSGTDWSRGMAMTRASITAAGDADEE